jgi:hypothetical protein
LNSKKRQYKNKKLYLRKKPRYNYISIKWTFFKGLWINTMFNSQVVKDLNGQHYIICLRQQGLQNLTVQREKFYNKQASYQFVTRLNVPFGMWQNLASSNSFFSLQGWQNTHPSLSIEHYVAEALVLGTVSVYKTVDLQTINKNKDKTSFKDSSGKGYQLQPATNLLLLNGANQKTITNDQEATEFINQLNLSEQEIAELNQTYNLPLAGDASSTLKDAIVTGKVVITTTQPARKPVVTDYIDEVINAITPEPVEKPVSIAQDSNDRADNGSADALMKAAEDGAPFCEECEKARNAA